MRVQGFVEECCPAVLGDIGAKRVSSTCELRSNFQLQVTPTQVYRNPTRIILLLIHKAQMSSSWFLIVPTSAAETMRKERWAPQNKLQEGWSGATWHLSDPRPRDNDSPLYDHAMDNRFLSSQRHA